MYFLHFHTDINLICAGDDVLVMDLGHLGGKRKYLMNTPKGIMVPPGGNDARSEGVIVAMQSPVNRFLFLTAGSFDPPNSHATSLAGLPLCRLSRLHS